MSCSSISLFWRAILPHSSSSTPSRRTIATPPERGAPEASKFDAALPPIESIDAQTDITVLLVNGVPQKHRCANIRGSGAEAAAEFPVKRRQVPEADVVDDGADRAMGMARVRQHAMDLGKTLTKHELRQRCALALEQSLNVADAHVMAACQRGHGDVSVP